MRNQLLVCIITGIITPFFAMASDIYGVVSIGSHLGDDVHDKAHTAGLPEFDGELGVTFGIGVGYKISDNVRVESRFNYRENASSNHEIGSISPLGDIPLLWNADLQSKEISLNAIYDIKEFYGVMPYLKGGLGYAWNQYSGTLFSDDFIALQGTNNIAFLKDSQNGLTWNLGVGGSYPINSLVMFFAEYQYTNLGDVYTGNDSLDALGSYGTGDYSVNEINIGTRISF